MTSPFPPPPASGKPRKLWPWFLGGCLLLLLAGVLAFAAIVYFGAKMIGTASRDIVGGIPLVQEHFGTITSADLDTNLGALMAAGGSGKAALSINITGEKGVGVLTIQIDPISQQFSSATLTLPNGEVRQLDTAALRQLQALQQGQWPLPQP